MAKMANCWRAPHMSARIYKVWESLTSSDRAKAAAGRLPPRPLIDRFGACYKTAAFFLFATQRE
eukprot:5503897-Pyramimonas_sp.AAC.1